MTYVALVAFGKVTVLMLNVRHAAMIGFFFNKSILLTYRSEDEAKE